MHLILGGKYQGKLAYAKSLYPDIHTVYNLAHESPRSIIIPGLITNIHFGVRRLLIDGTDPIESVPPALVEIVSSFKFQVSSFRFQV